MKALTKIRIGFLAVVAVALWFTSCSSEDVASGTNQGKMSSLTLSINTGKSMGSRATDWTKDDPGADKVKTENKINRVAIGIFSTEGKVKTIVELTPGETSTPGTNSLTQTDANNATANIVTSSLVANDQVLVAINAPSGRFAGCKDKAAFMAKTESAAEALANYDKTSLPTPTTQVEKNIPMFGSASLSAVSGSSSSFTANVDVIHMIAKVSLAELKVDFKAVGAYADAEFTPKAVFLINVPNSLQFDNNNAWPSSSSVGYEHGWGAFDTNNTYVATKANDDAAAKFDGSTFKEYLTTPELTGKTLKVVADATGATGPTYDKQVYFYTMPNGQVGDKATKLVIAGQFKASGVDKVVYYPLFLNAKVNSTGTDYGPAGSESEAKKVYPNKNYKCTVVIRNIGADSPDINLDPKAASISITVKDFEEVDQTTEFN